MRQGTLRGSVRLYLNLSLIFLFLISGSCAVITVDSGLSGPSALTVGQTGTYSVGASDPSTKSLTYTWYVDGIEIVSNSSNSGSSALNYAALQADLGATHRIRVDINDGKGQNKSFSMNVHVSGSNPGGNPQVEIMGPATTSATTYARLSIPAGHSSIFIAATNLGTHATSFPTIKNFQSRNLSDSDSSWSLSPPSRNSGNGTPSSSFNGPVPKAPPAIVTRFQNGPERGASGIGIRSLANGTAPRVWTGPASGPVPPSINNSQTVGASATFNTVRDDGLTWDPITATLDATGTLTASDGQQVTVDVWVANAGIVDNASLKTSAANSLLGAFAIAAPHIYDLDTNVFGTEWYHGTTSASNGYIGAANRISILMYDINEDAPSGSLNPNQGYTVGYFHPLHNYVYKANDPDLQFANQEIMFVIDYPFYKDSPAVVYSTLAHEFQHMIHFYQRGVLKNLSSETWINEMMSMMTEDEVDPEMGITGPAMTRLGEYNNYPDSPLESWGSYAAGGGDPILESYALHYSFGAYLIRNFGGVKFLRALIQSNQQSGEGMVNDALLANGSALKFGDVERRWPAAVLLSNSNQSTEFLYTGSSSTIGTTAYTTPALNFFDPTYATSKGDGPSNTGDSSTFNPNGFWGSSFAAGSTIYHKPVSSATTGTYAFITNLPAHVGLTAVYK